jgi:hypothetical protein
MQAAGYHFLIAPGRCDHFGGRQDTDGGQRPHLHDVRGQRVAIGQREHLARRCERGGGEHPVRDRYAMSKPTVYGHGFERVTGGETEN